MRQIVTITLIAVTAMLVPLTSAHAQNTINITDVSNHFNNNVNPPTATADATFSATGLPDGSYELSIDSVNETAGGATARTQVSVTVTNGTGSIVNQSVSISELQKGDSGTFRFIISSVDGKWTGDLTVNWYN